MNNLSMIRIVNCVGDLLNYCYELAHNNPENRVYSTPFEKQSSRERTRKIYKVRLRKRKGRKKGREK